MFWKSKSPDFGKPAIIRIHRNFKAATTGIHRNLKAATIISTKIQNMSRMEVRQGMLKRMSHRQSYHSDRHARVFEHMVGHYGVQLDGDYAPPGYDEQQQCREDT
ncbi:hypothetical protein Tco_0275676 [Tanacetum coccineum]